MFELLIPNRLKDRDDEGSRNLLLVLDSDTARYPWELLGSRTGKSVKAVSLEGGLIRQFRTSGFRAVPRPPHANNALVIGDTISGMPNCRAPSAKPSMSREHLSFLKTIFAEGRGCNNGRLTADRSRYQKNTGIAVK